MVKLFAPGVLVVAACLACFGGISGCADPPGRTQTSGFVGTPTFGFVNTPAANGQAGVVSHPDGQLTLTAPPGFVLVNPGSNGSPAIEHDVLLKETHVWDTPASITIDRAPAASLQELARRQGDGLPDYRVFLNASQPMLGRNVLVLGDTHLQDGRPVRTSRYFIPAGKFVYIVALTVSEADWERYRSVFAKTIRSITLQAR